MIHQAGKVRWLLLVAVVLVLGAAVSAWWWMQRNSEWPLGLSWPAGTAPLERSLADMDHTIERLTQRVSELEQQLADQYSALAAQVDAQGSAIEGREARLRERIDGAQQQSREARMEALASIDAMQERITRIQAEQDQALDALREQGQALPQIDRSVMRRLALVEAVALLNLGQQRLELANDPLGAVALYRQAAMSVAALDEARLGPVLRQIQREQAEIEALPSVDWTLWQARVLQLQATARRLAAESGALQGVQASEATGRLTDAQDERNWRERVQRGVGALVTVRPRESDDSALLDHRLRHQQLHAWLDTVLLAVYQHDAELARQSASRARALWPGATDSEAMEWLAALETLHEPSRDIELGAAVQRLRAELQGVP